MPLKEILLRFSLALLIFFLGNYISFKYLGGTINFSSFVCNMSCGGD